jgi:hypothetical protein
MQQRVRAGRKLDVNRHREEIRRLVADSPNEPTYCEFKKTLSYASKKEKGELVKDVSSFANIDLESLGGYGYIVFGVSNEGQVVGVEHLTGDPPSEIRRIINDHLDRAILFEYLTCEVNDKSGGSKWVAAIVVPDSRRRPHVTSREIKERVNNRDKFWLREHEVWVRKTGGRELATAEDIDAMYEGKLRRLVDERVWPLRERIERLEGDLRERRSAVPELGFGFLVDDVDDSGAPSPKGKPYPVLGNLIRVEGVHEEIEWARQRAEEETAQAGLMGLGLGRDISAPSARDYEDYRDKLEAWLRELEDVLAIDFVLTNTGRVPAEDVQVSLDVPAELQPSRDLPLKPQQPHT